MKEHVDQNIVVHAQIQAESFMMLKLHTEKNTSSLQHLLERTNSLETRIASMEKAQSLFDLRMKSSEEKMDRVEQHRMMEQLDIQNIKGSTNIYELEQKFEKLQQEVNTMQSSNINTGLTSGYRTGELHSTYGHIPISLASSTGISQNTSSSMMALGSEFNPMGSLRVESLHARVVELEHSVDRSLSSCLDQELRIQLLERATYNGILLWKVDEFERRRKEAKEGITLSLYSTPFYTNRHGYKMCARIYLNGDGLGKDTHMSFFFVVMRGPIDELLQWPFKQKVTLTLVNQMGKKHVTDSFRPDPNSSSFQRPGRREMNIASGCPMFMRLEHLLKGGFVKDDCIYLRVMVEKTDPNVGFN